MRATDLVGLGLVCLLAGCTAQVESRPDAAPSTLAIAAPPANATVDYQLGGAYPPAADVGVVTRDRTAQPDPDRYSICYVNAFQTQPEDAAYWSGERADLVVRVGGRPVEDPDWPGEWILDTSTSAKRERLLAIVGGWFDGCADDGFRAVEPDNLDSWTRSRDRLTSKDNVAFARLLITRAHERGLAIGQKNAPELADRELGFDFAVAEECQAYDECSAYTDAYGDRVIEIEYADLPDRFYTAACRARGAEISVIFRDRDVVPRGEPGYVAKSC